MRALLRTTPLVLVAAISAVLSLAGSSPGARAATPTSSPPAVSLGVDRLSLPRGSVFHFSIALTDPTAGATGVSWAFDGVGAGQATLHSGATQRVAQSFSTVGRHILSVALGGSETVATEQVMVYDVPPTADFSFDPAQVRTGEAVRLVATVHDADGDALACSWDTDGDGSYGDERGCAGVTLAFARPGSHRVSLQVDDGNGGLTARSRSIVVADRGPDAAFSVHPAQPVAGEAVTFDSTLSRDPDGLVAGRAWDLDGDGAFDDGTEVVAMRSFAAAGAHHVALRVLDDDSATAIARTTVTVLRRPSRLAGQHDVRIHYGDHVRLATVLTDERTALPVRGATVGLYRASVGSTDWTLVTKAVTDADGTASYLARPEAGTRYEWRYAGTRTYRAPATSAATNVVVLQSVRASAHPSRVQGAAVITVSGTLEPGGSGLIFLQRLVDGRWTWAGHAPLTRQRDSSGHWTTTFRLSWRPQEHGSVVLRVYRPATGALGAGISASMTVRVG